MSEVCTILSDPVLSSYIVHSLTAIATGGLGPINLYVINRIIDCANHTGV